MAYPSLKERIDAIGSGVRQRFLLSSKMLLVITGTANRGPVAVLSLTEVGTEFYPPYLVPKARATLERAVETCNPALPPSEALVRTIEHDVERSLTETERVELHKVKRESLKEQYQHLLRSYEAELKFASLETQEAVGRAVDCTKQINRELVDGYDKHHWIVERMGQFADTDSVLRYVGSFMNLLTFGYAAKVHARELGFYAERAVAWGTLQHIAERSSGDTEKIAALLTALEHPAAERFRVLSNFTGNLAIAARYEYERMARLSARANAYYGRMFNIPLPDAPNLRTFLSEKVLNSQVRAEPQLTAPSASPEILPTIGTPSAP